MDSNIADEDHTRFDYDVGSAKKTTLDFKDSPTIYESSLVVLQQMRADAVGVSKQSAILNPNKAITAETIQQCSVTPNVEFAAPTAEEQLAIRKLIDFQDTADCRTFESLRRARLRVFEESNDAQMSATTVADVHDFHSVEAPTAPTQSQTPEIPFITNFLLAYEQWLTLADRFMDRPHELEVQQLLKVRQLLLDWPYVTLEDWRQMAQLKYSIPADWHASRDKLYDSLDYFELDIMEGALRAQTLITAAEWNARMQFSQWMSAGSNSKWNNEHYASAKTPGSRLSRSDRSLRRKPAAASASTTSSSIGVNNKATAYSNKATTKAPAASSAFASFPIYCCCCYPATRKVQSALSSGSCTDGVDLNIKYKDSGNSSSGSLELVVVAADTYSCWHNMRDRLITWPHYTAGALEELSALLETWETFGLWSIFITHPAESITDVLIKLSALLVLLVLWLLSWLLFQSLWHSDFSNDSQLCPRHPRDPLLALTMSLLGVIYLLRSGFLLLPSVNQSFLLGRRLTSQLEKLQYAGILSSSLRDVGIVDDFMRISYSSALSLLNIYFVYSSGDLSRMIFSSFMLEFFLRLISSYKALYFRYSGSCVRQVMAQEMHRRQATLLPYLQQSLIWKWGLCYSYSSPWHCLGVLLHISNLTFTLLLPLASLAAIVAGPLCL